MLILSFLAATVGNASPTAKATNPLIYAEMGLLQCLRPDRVNRTCRVVNVYRKTGTNTYDDVAIVLISSHGPLTVETQTPVVVSGDAVCATIRTEEIKAGTLRKAGRVVAPFEAAKILTQVAQRVAPLEGQETCTRYERSGDDFNAKVSVSGKYKSELDTEVRWITPADGYLVEP